MRIDEVSLVLITYPSSYSTGVESSRVMCLAERKDPNRSEFYTAEQAGHIIAAIFEVSPLDYSQQNRLIHGTDVYTIVRAHKLEDQPDTVQLSCERREGL